MRSVVSARFGKESDRLGMGLLQGPLELAFRERCSRGVAYYE